MKAPRPSKNPTAKPEPGLASLLAPFDVATFFADYWLERPLHIPGSPERLLSILGVPELEGFHSLQRVWKGEALTLGKRGGDESKGYVVSGHAIKLLFDAGLPMFLHRPELQFPAIAEWVEALRHDLGVPTHATFVCSTHATPGGTHTGLHFDDAISFVLQLQGQKVWKLAPNRSIPQPIERHAKSMPALHGTLAELADGPMPDEMPADAIEVTLEPGSVLFVPSGWWHEVEGPSESLALMFIILNLSWADVIAAAVRRVLVQDASLREFAFGAKNENHRHHAAAERRVGELLADLPQKLAELRPRDVLATRYIRVPTTACAFDGDTLTLDGRTTESSIHLSAEHAEVMRAILSRTRPVTVDQLTAKGFDRKVVVDLLATLVKLDYFRLD